MFIRSQIQSSFSLSISAMEFLLSGPCKSIDRSRQQEPVALPFLAVL
jgi:hypothetical protein